MADMEAERRRLMAAKSAAGASNVPRAQQYNQAARRAM